MCGEEILEKLKACLNSRVRLAFRDGEVLVGDLDFLLEDENAIVFDLIESNRPDRYERSDKRPHIFASISDIVHCEKADGAPPIQQQGNN
jgi:small nuclear ribonucleoprotein (snRNP)-like protein